MDSDMSELVVEEPNISALALDWVHSNLYWASADRYANNKLQCSIYIIAMIEKITKKNEIHYMVHLCQVLNA